MTEDELWGQGGKLILWRDTCAALGAGTVEEPATSPPGAGAAGKARGFRGRVLRAGRGSWGGFSNSQKLRNATKYGLTLSPQQSRFYRGLSPFILTDPLPSPGTTASAHSSQLKTRNMPSTSKKYTTPPGTFYDRNAGIRPLFYDLNLGIAYGISAVGNTEVVVVEEGGG